ncbi:MAG: DNA-3-methyladenine glycosylase [Bacteroidales bacterium]|nr:DNA-3-methyladenine glycosylase [Bacteroidales bacterium]
MEPGTRLGRDFYIRDVLEVAPELPGKILVTRGTDGSFIRSQITEVEAYRGTDDLACHASKGRTARTEVMFSKGGHLYVYLVYGMHWMLNIVTGAENDPQAVLIRGLSDCAGPGKLTRLLGIDRSFNGEDLVNSKRIWVEDSGFKPECKTGFRIGIDYAGEYWKTRPWRFFL